MVVETQDPDPVNRGEATPRTEPVIVPTGRVGCSVASLRGTELAIGRPCQTEDVVASLRRSDPVVSSSGCAEPALASPRRSDPVLEPLPRTDHVVADQGHAEPLVACLENSGTGIHLRSKLTVPRVSLGEFEEGDDGAFDDLADIEEERRPSGDEDLMARSRGVDLSFPLNDEDPGLPDGAADAALSDSFRSLQSGAEGDDDDAFSDVDRPVVVKKKKARPDPPGSSFPTMSRCGFFERDATFLMRSG